MKVNIFQKFYVLEIFPLFIIEHKIQDKEHHTQYDPVDICIAGCRTCFKQEMLMA